MKPLISNALLDEFLKNDRQPDDLLGLKGMLTELKKNASSTVFSILSSPPTIDSLYKLFCLNLKTIGVRSSLVF